MISNDDEFTKLHLIVYFILHKLNAQAGDLDGSDVCTMYAYIIIRRSESAICYILSYLYLSFISVQ